ncbi:MAG TPA: SPOR domain-containing protein [Terriglobales bacterium]|nr:SPOR domain-containing protein [Terriglobales bacterium]
MAELGTGRVRQEIGPEDLLEELRDTEITLGTGKLLGIFFGLVIVCAVFFTMGYLLGKSSVDGAHTQIVGTTLTPSSTAGKPSAEMKEPSAPAPASSPDASQANSNPGSSNDSSAPAPASSSTAPADIKSSPTGSFLVQVAAVSKQEDAEILVSALRKKQYPVFVANVPGDPLFHVQVGPFTTQLDAETMRNRLAGDGYNAIVKH